MGMDDAYKMINQTLVSLINEIWELEEKAIITDEFKDLTNNDMHVIEAVGLGDGNNMSSIARKLNITVGSLTTAMNSLVNKRYVERHRSEEDRRVVLVKLTEKSEFGIILRAKGMVSGADGKWIYFDAVPEEYEIREGGADYTGRICVIGQNLNEEKLEKLFKLA